MLPTREKNQIWEEIMKDVNAMGKPNRTVQEVTGKWKNLHSTAKKEFSIFTGCFVFVAKLLCWFIVREV